MANEILTTLHPDNDESTNLYPNIKGDNIPYKAINRLKLDDSINTLLNSINVLKPSGADTSTNILAFTSDKGIYIGTDTNKWYYWNGTKYVEGGSFIESVDQYNVVSSVELTPTWIDNSYIWKDGNAGTLIGYSISEPIDLNVGDVIEFNAKGYLNNIAMISLYNDNYKPVIISIDSNKQYYSYVCTENCQVVLCSQNADRGSVRIYTNSYLKSLFEIINVINKNTHSIKWNNKSITWNNGYYISSGGNKYISSNWSISDEIELNAGDILYVNAQGYSTNVAIVSIYENGKYIPVVISEDANNHLFMYASPSACKVVLSTNNSNKALYCRIFTSNLLAYNGKYTDLRINQLKNELAYPTYKMTNLSLFEKIGVVGDSFASGYLYDENDNASNYYNLSWVQIMARNLGITGFNFSKGGLSTRTWLQDYDYGLNKLLTSDKCGLYILALGINDIYISNYIGTISDIHDNPALNPDTFYGNYGKIISNILSYTPKSKIVISTIKHPDSRINDINNAIIEIASHFNIPVISQTDNWYFKTSFFNTFNHGHPIAITYSGMATAFIDMIQQCMVDNRTYFDDFLGVGD